MFIDGKKKENLKMYKENFNEAAETRKNDLKKHILQVKQRIATYKKIKIVTKKDGGKFVDLKRNFSEIISIEKRHHWETGAVYEYKFYFENNDCDFFIDLEYNSLKYDNEKSEIENIYNFIQFYINKNEKYLKSLLKQYDHFCDYLEKLSNIYNQLHELLENKNDTLLHDYQNRYYNTSLYYSMIEIFSKGL